MCDISFGVVISESCSKHEAQWRPVRAYILRKHNINNKEKKEKMCVIRQWFMHARLLPVRQDKQ